MLTTLLLMVVAFVLTLLLYPVLNRFYKKKKLVRENYRGQLIPLGTGVIFSLVWLLTFVLGMLVFYDDKGFMVTGLAFFLALLFMAVLGFIDDFYGNTQIKGLKGHFKALFRGHLTTGAAKALGGALVAVLVAWYFSTGLWSFIINFLVAVLSINYVNLLDLRPGRAGKGFLLYALLILILGIGKPETIYLWLLAAVVLAHIGLDLRALVMMGDAGSNSLGAALGFTAVAVLGLPVKAVLAVLLIAFHLLTEKYSLTELISKNKILNYFDQLGRG